jgi:flagellin-like protein
MGIRRRGTQSGVRDNRGASEVLGAIILIALAVSAAVLLLVVGGDVVEDVENENRVQMADQSLQQVASEFERIRRSETESVQFDLSREIGSDIQAESEARVTLFANDNATCTTGEIEIGTLLYDAGNGDTVGYEFGGVWRGSEGDTSSMIRTPNIEYRDGRLAISMSQLQSRVPGSSSIAASLNGTASRQMTANLTRSLFVNKTATELVEGPTTPVGELSACQPNTVENITVSIENSRFATGWHSFAHRNFDDRLVTVTPGENADVTAGDTVTMNFKVQDTSFDDFSVRNVESVSSAPADEDVPVNARVINRGDLAGTNEVTLDLYYEASGSAVSGATPVETESITLEGGERTWFNATIPASLTAENTEYRYSIDTGDTVYNGTVQIGNNGDDWPHFDIVSLDAPDEASAASDPELEAEIENTGDLAANQTITFEFEDNEETTRWLYLNGSEQETIVFDVPTRREGVDFELNVSSDDDFETRPISIGDTNYFEINETRSPVAVTTGSEFDINATIRNIQELAGTQTVELRVQNESTGAIYAQNSSTLDLNGTFQGTESAPINVTVLPIADRGRYNFTVTTGNETTSKSFYVGSKPTEFFQVSSVAPDPNPVEQNDTTTVTAVINNTGASGGEQQVEFNVDDGGRTSPQVSAEQTLGPGRGTTVEFDYDVPSSLPAGTYDYTVETANTSVTSQIRVSANLSEAIDGVENGTISLEGNTTARLQVLGTEPTAFNSYYPYILRAPTVMDIVTENETHGRVNHNIWGNADLNTPSRWEDQVNRAAYLNRSITISNASELWVSATTYGCNNWQKSTSVGPRYVSPYGWADRYYCQSSGGTLVAINSNQNTNNVVILGDGDKVPSWDSASDDQRSISDILDDKFDSSTGTLNLEEDQRVLLFELTQPNADPGEASESDADPDYNDAVVLFEVVNRTRSVETPTRLEITDTEAPASVGETEVDTLRVEVTNRGGKTGSTDVAYTFDGSSIDSESTGDLDYNESAWVEFDLPPDASYAPGTYGYEVQLTANTNQSRAGNVFIGSDPDPRFIVTGFEKTYPRTVKQGSSPTVTATIANVGDEDATMSVDWQATGPSGTTRTATQSTTIASDSSKQVTFTDVPTSETGSVSFEVATPNDTRTDEIYVENEEFVIDSVYIGTDSYGDGETIVRSTVDNIDAAIQNVGNVEGTQTVTFELTNRSTGTTRTVDTDVTLGDGDADLVPFGLGSWANATGYYDYTITTGDDSQSGTIQIIDPSASDIGENDADYISIDMNVITFE